MPDRVRHILQVNTEDIGGGAARVAWTLHERYRARQLASTLAVGHKRGGDCGVVEIPNDAGKPAATRVLLRLADDLRANHDHLPGAWRAGRALHWLAEPAREWDRIHGREDFHFPGTQSLLDLARNADVVHLHNLHGGYFDLRLLPELSHAADTFITLHDAWMLSGHCAHSLGCDRWRSGCGECPALDLYPAVQRDATAENWRTKAELFRRSKLHVATPCRWLMDKVDRSMLAQSMLSQRVIPNGVDLDVFQPAEPLAAREALGLPLNARVLLFAASGIRKSAWKDFAMLREAIERVAHHLTDRPVVFVALGEQAPPERIGRAELRFVPFEADPRKVAIHYQTADLYLHAARADTFPNTVIEALACGTPAVATAVGGIPEQIDDGDTGRLTPPGDPAAMARVIHDILTDPARHAAMSRRAATVARERFGLERQAAAYLDWFAQIKETRRAAA